MEIAGTIELAVSSMAGAKKVRLDRSRRGIRANPESRRHCERSEAIFLPFDMRLHVFQEPPHFLDWAKGDQFNPVRMTNHPELFARNQTERFPNGLWDDRLEFRRNGDGVYAEGLSVARVMR